MSFAALVRQMPQQAIVDDVQYENTVEVIDRLMSAWRLTRGQRQYLETLVQPATAYESSHHAIDTTSLTGLDSLRYLLDENGMSASDLARLLDVHPSMGSKILQGERALTVTHLKALAARFMVSAELFID